MNVMNPRRETQSPRAVHQNKLPGRRNLEEKLLMAIGRMETQSVIGTASVLPTERSRPSKG